MKGEPAEHHLEVRRTARYWVLGDAVARPEEIWYVLHGYRQLAQRFLRRFAVLDDGTRHVVAPEGLSRFYTGTEPGRHGPQARVGATWMTREDRDHEIGDYVAYLDALARTRGAGVEGPPRVTVLGFSQGVATAARWTVLGAMRPHRLLLWGDFVPPDLDLRAAGRAWAGTEVILVRGDEDRVVRDVELAQAEEARMAAAGLTPRTVRYAGGHEIQREALLALARAPAEPGDQSSGPARTT